MKATTPQMSSYTIESVICYENVLYQPGTNNVETIQQHVAQREGDRWYYDIIFHNGDVLRLFDVKSVGFTRKESTDGTKTDV